MKKVLKVVGCIILALVILVGAGAAYLTITEYNPKSVEELDYTCQDQTVSVGDQISITTFNIGYAGLGKDEDFFMDGGSKVMPESPNVVMDNLGGLSSDLNEIGSDICFLQEVDRDSKRSYRIDELDYLENALDKQSVFALNYKCNFVPFPFPTTIGKVNGGVAVLSNYDITSAKRIALPVSFKWPVRTANLKRCIMEIRIPVEGSDKELVLYNFHLDAYDDGEGRIAQTKEICKLLEEEKEKGNYIVAGGDFNQVFDFSDKYPIFDLEGWLPGAIGYKDIPEGFVFAIDDSVPTCRSLKNAYTGSYKDTQVFMIDGFILSDNLELVSVETKDCGFEYSDHNPVNINIKIK